MIKLCTLIAAVSACSAVAKTPFLASDLPTENLDFCETFDEKTGGLFTSSKWIKSGLAKYKHQPVMVKPALNAAPGFEKDKGLQLTQEMKYYGVSTKLKKPVAPQGGDVVFQYEVKFDVFTCGGAYLKFLRDSDELALDALGDSTPFSVMFGPDRCGMENKVHFIMQHQSPITGEWEEKHFNETPPVEVDKLTHLYTLAIHGADNSFEIYIDQKKKASGNLLTHMRPSINPPTEVDDPTDSKPGDWIDAKMIPDPAASKPEDWDETLPATIPDTTVTMPHGWKVDWAITVPDPTAEKPEDWDDEEDGDWEAPEISNPACEEVPGCGHWAPPNKKNPNYKGKWAAPMVPNPAYIGEWTPRQIPNKDYFEEPNPSHLAPIAAVAVEVWTTNPGIHFDNIIIAHNLDDAWAFADASFSIKRLAERKKLDEDEAEELAKVQKEKLANGGIGAFIEIYIVKLIQYLESNPHLQRRFNDVVSLFSGLLGPEGVQLIEENAASIIIGFIVVTALALLFFCCACVLPPGKEVYEEVEIEVEVETEDDKHQSHNTQGSSKVVGDVSEDDTAADEISTNGLRNRKKKATRKDN